MLQTIKRIHYEVYYWSRVDEAIISNISLQVNVWVVDNENEEVHYGSLVCFTFPW